MLYKKNMKRDGLCLGLLTILFMSSADAYKRFNEPVEALRIVKPYLPKNPVILEAGAFDGSDSLKILKFWPKAKLHSFEPVPQNYKLLAEKAKKHDNMRTYPIALSNANGSAKFYVSEHSNNPGVPGQSSSLLAPKEHLAYAPTVLFKNEITVPTLTIDTWAAEYGVNKIDFMWLDMQGFELNALKACPHILKTVKAILTEVEFVEAYEGQYLYEEVKKWLESQGFELLAINFDPNNKPWFADALFVRKK
jgi:FkbM family methyltransferase